MSLQDIKNILSLKEKNYAMEEPEALTAAWVTWQLQVFQVAQKWRLIKDHLS